MLDQGLMRVCSQVQQCEGVQQHTVQYSAPCCVVLCAVQRQALCCAALHGVWDCFRGQQLCECWLAAHAHDEEPYLPSGLFT